MTELEAVNRLLRAIGEASVASLTGTLPSDVEDARAAIRNATAELCNQRFDFNVSIGMPCPLLGSYQENGRTLRVFGPPSTREVTWFQPSLLPTQRRLTLALARTTTFQLAGQSVLAFRDRIGDRDGLEVEELLMDVALVYTYDELPPVARRAAAMLAMRDFIADKTADANLVALGTQRAQMAMRDLAERHAIEDRYTALGNTTALSIMGAQFGRYPLFDATPIDPRIRR